MKIRDRQGNQYKIQLPSSAPTNKGEKYIVCPICTPRRKPEHKNQALLAVNVQRTPHPWRCNHCGEAGYVFTDEEIPHQKIRPLLSWPKWKEPEQKHYDWIQKRSLTRETVDHFKVTVSIENIKQLRSINPELKGKWVNTSCLNFPYYQEGLLINIKYRDPRKNFKLIAGAVNTFYNIDSIKGKDYCIIVEGEFDCMSYHQAGLTSVVSVPNGATISEIEKKHYLEKGFIKVFNPLNLDYLDLNIESFDHLKTIYIATDDDPTGIKLRVELARRLGKERCKYIKFSDYRNSEDKPIKDANELLQEKGESVLANTINLTYEFPIENVSVASDFMEELLSDFDHGREKGKSTGYISLDPHFSLMPGWVYLLAGYPNNGKTLFWLNIMAISSVLYGDKWGIYSPENYPEKYIIDSIAEIMLDNTSSMNIIGRTTRGLYKDVITEHIDKYFFLVNNDEGYSPEELRKVKEELIKKKGITGFFCDPWSALNHVQKKFEREDQYIARMLNEEIRLASKYNIINVISHHPPNPERKDVNLKAPHPYQLAGGAMWWNKCHVICAVHRFNQGNWTETKSEFHVQKVKDEKIFGEKTNQNEPIMLSYKRRSGRFLERKNPEDPNSEYNRYPIRKWESKKQLNFEDF